MLSWEEAQSTVLARTPVLPGERVALNAAAGRVLAEPLIARNDSPPFAVSAVDGFAVHPTDVAAASQAGPVRLRLAGVVHAGDSVAARLARRTAIKILTGAAVPQGAGAVVMQEYCAEASDHVQVLRSAAAGENIRRRGAEFRKGREVLPTGVRVTPPVMGLLATFGYPRVMVHRRPTVAILVTGDELLSPTQPLGPGKIRDANSYALAAAVQALGIADCRTLRLKDRPALLKKRFAEALGSCDVLLIAGGMSVGDRDYARPILDELGVREQFWRVAVKPGKPAFFGTFERPQRKPAGARSRHPCLVFGLPGNPVSALVCFHQLVKPALLKMMGLAAAASPAHPARLAGERRKPRGRLEWLRGVLSWQDGEALVQPTSGQESHMLGGLARANCLIQFPQDAEVLADGTQVLVEPLSWQE